ncbi:hypothetical protein TNCV_4037821 [Trichonephila clavipes]|nr:hypothetical protein TNCV_4037821 [Trichonephila clavipes]
MGIHNHRRCHTPLGQPGREVLLDKAEDETVVPYPIEGLFGVEEDTPGCFSVVKSSDHQIGQSEQLMISSCFFPEAVLM